MVFCELPPTEFVTCRNSCRAVRFVPPLLAHDCRCSLTNDETNERKGKRAKPDDSLSRPIVA